jgi:hypothetical protein
MRVSYSYAVRDQNRLVSGTRTSSPACRPSSAARCGDGSSVFKLTLDDDIALFEGLYRRYRDARRVKVQLAPANLHWCSDEALTRLADCSRKYGVPLHMHLVETAYQNVAVVVDARLVDPNRGGDSIGLELVEGRDTGPESEI